MHQADIRLIQHLVGRLRVDPLQLRGEGGPFAPALVVPIELDLHEADGQKLVLDRLQAELWTRPGAGARVRLGLPVTVEWAGRGDTRPLVSLPRGGTHHLELRIDLMTAGVRLLDAHVHSATEGQVMLTLELQARLGVLKDATFEALPSLSNPSVQTVHRFWGTTVEELEIQLTREQWAEQLAPALGHDRMRLIAVEMPSPSGPLGTELAPLFDAASRAYDAADWRETIQKCRDIRNHIEEHARQEPGERLFQVVAGRTGADEDDARIKFLDDVWAALATVTSESHHIQSIGRLDAATAHATLLLTATMIQYVGELLGPA
jgi:hypothetical protein